MGGECTDESLADAMGNKLGGAFRALIYSAQKYGFVTYSKGRVKTEPLYQDYKLAYTDAQKQEALRKAFLSVPLFDSLAKRLSGQTVPPHIEKLLIREHDVVNEMAARVADYFTEGGRDSGIVSGSGMVNADPQNITITPGAGSANLQAQTASVTTASASLSDAPQVSPVTVRGYTVRVTGPGIDSTIAIKDEDDVLIVESMLKKVRKLLAVEDELLK
jgi:hypothetical protein